MLSAIKRIVNSNNNSSSTNNNFKNHKSDQQLQINHIQQNQSNGMQSISQSLQKKFSRGVNYNMKIIIRGDCNTGKTCLWLRLQGQQYKELYEPSDEIKVANINWNYKLGDNDIVKVEIWDVVDKSKKKRQLTTNSRLKLDNSDLQTQIPIEASLDAEFIDVYKNCNGCILVYDITKQWTWDYIERELPKIPSHIPVLILGNHKDMHHHRTIQDMKCRYFIDTLNRGSMGSIVRYAEASMRNGFGLTYLYKFFNIPFLLLQRETLMQQLEVNAKEMDNVNEELCFIESNEDSNYDVFITNLTNKRRVESEQLASNVLKNAKSVEEAKKEALEREENEKLHEMPLKYDRKKFIDNIIQKITPKIEVNTQTITNNNTNELLKSSNSKTNTSVLESILPDTVDEFNKFLEDSKINESLSKTTLLQSNNKKNEDSDSDEKENNPMVLNYSENVDLSEDDTKNKKIIKNVNDSNQILINDTTDDEIIENNNLKKLNSHINNKNKIENDFVLIKYNDGLSITSSVYSHKDKEEYEQNKLNENNLIKDITTKIKLSNDDFEFLDKLGNNNSISSTKTQNISKDDFLEEIKSNENKGSHNETKSEDKLPKKKKKHSKSSKKPLDSDNIKNEKKPKILPRDKISKEKRVDHEENDESDKESTVHIKKHMEYEEI